MINNIRPNILNMNTPQRAYELLAKLRLLTLVGFENGELIWCGSDMMWRNLTVEEESILREWDLTKTF